MESGKRAGYASVPQAATVAAADFTGDRETESLCRHAPVCLALAAAAAFFTHSAAAHDATPARGGPEDGAKLEDDPFAGWQFQPKYIDRRVFARVDWSVH